MVLSWTGTVHHSVDIGRLRVEMASSQDRIAAQIVAEASKHDVYAAWLRGVVTGAGEPLSPNYGIDRGFGWSIGESNS